MQTPYRQKFLALIMMYVALLALIMWFLARGTSSWPEASQRAAQQIFILFVTPNIAAFAVGAFFLRRYWSRLIGPGIAIPSAIAAVMTVVVLGGMNAILARIMDQRSLAYGLAVSGLLFIPGTLAAQLLRLRWGLEVPTVPSDSQ
jgi:hypothetical protein